MNDWLLTAGLLATTLAVLPVTWAAFLRSEEQEA